METIMIKNNDLVYLVILLSLGIASLYVAIFFKE